MCANQFTFLIDYFKQQKQRIELSPILEVPTIGPTGNNMKVIHSLVVSYQS